MTPFWGKYRARVDDNADPYKLGRLKLKVPDVLGDNVSGWALPCFPFAAAGNVPGGGVGLFLIPPKDAWVWAEFEHGEADKPIWSGCFFPPDATALASTMSALLPLTGVDPAKQVLKAGKWLITIDGDTLTFEHLLQVVARARLKADGTTVKLSTEPVPGGAAPTCATIELSSTQATIDGMPIQVGQ